MLHGSHGDPNSVVLTLMAWFDSTASYAPDLGRNSAVLTSMSWFNSSRAHDAIAQISRAGGAEAAAGAHEATEPGAAGI